MKRFLTVFVICISLCFSAALPADAAIKAGKTCAKAGMKLVSSSKTFTCIKSGRKLIWNKGVNLNPPTITFSNLDPNWTSIVARNDLQQYLAQVPTPASTAEIISGPTVDPTQLLVEKELLATAGKMFSEYYVPSRYQVVFFSENDGAWVDSTLLNLGGSYLNTISEEIEKWKERCNFAFATKGKTGIPIYYQCMDTKGRTIEDRQTPIHEYFHLVQYNYNKSGSLPCWLLEGSPTYFGVALGIDNKDSSGKSGWKFLKNLMWQYNPDGMNQIQINNKLANEVLTDEGIKRVFHALELKPTSAGDNCVSLGAYSMGGFATEALIAVKGFKVYMDFLASLGDSSFWKESFLKYFGITTEDFYSFLGSYIRARTA